MKKIVTKWQVYDEAGILLRWFYTKQDAEKFACGQDYTVVKLTPPKIDWYKEMGEARW